MPAEGTMRQSQKDANIMVAWITGGFALVGTVITLLFTNGIIGPNPGGSPTSPPPTTITPPVTPSTPTPPVTPPTPTPTVTPPIPPEVVGNWRGGAAGQVNLHLTITESTDFVLWNDDAPGPPARGKIAVKGAILELYGDDGYLNRFPWSVEETPQGDVLHLGVNHYLRE